MREKVLCIVFLFCMILAKAQNPLPASEVNDSILLNGGRYVVAHITDTNGFSVEITKLHSRKHKKREILKENIFSIKYGATGKESVFYIYDTLIGNDFTVAEARQFIAGEQDAQRGYHALGTSAAAFVIGTISGSLGTFYAIAPPFAFAGFMSYNYVRIRHKSVKNMENVKHDAYLQGYSLVARKKRTLRAMLWGGIGMIAGTFLHNIYHINPQ